MTLKNQQCFEEKVINIIIAPIPLILGLLGLGAHGFMNQFLRRSCGHSHEFKGVMLQSPEAGVLRYLPGSCPGLPVVDSNTVREESRVRQSV